MLIGTHCPEEEPEEETNKVSFTALGLAEVDSPRGPLVSGRDARVLLPALPCVGSAIGDARTEPETLDHDA